MYSNSAKTDARSVSPVIKYTGCRPGLCVDGMHCFSGQHPKLTKRCSRWAEACSVSTSKTHETLQASAHLLLVRTEWELMTRPQAASRSQGFSASILDVFPSVL